MVAQTVGRAVDIQAYRIASTRNSVPHYHLHCSYGINWQKWLSLFKSCSSDNAQNQYQPHEEAATNIDCHMRGPCDPVSCTALQAWRGCFVAHMGCWAVHDNFAAEKWRGGLTEIKAKTFQFIANTLSVNLHELQNFYARQAFRRAYILRNISRNFSDRPKNSGQTETVVKAAVMHRTYAKAFRCLPRATEVCVPWHGFTYEN